MNFRGDWIHDAEGSLVITHIKINESFVIILKRIFGALPCSSRFVYTTISESRIELRSAYDQAYFRELEFEPMDANQLILHESGAAFCIRRVGAWDSMIDRSFRSALKVAAKELSESGGIPENE